jgi:hypothetical protein
MPKLLTQDDIFKLLPKLYQAQKDLARWTFAQDVFGNGVDKLDVHCNWEYNDEGGYDPHITTIAAFDHDGHYMQPDKTTDLWRQMEAGELRHETIYGSWRVDKDDLLTGDYHNVPDEPFDGRIFQPVLPTLILVEED